MDHVGDDARGYQYRYRFGRIECDEQAWTVRLGGTLILDSNPVLTELLFALLGSGGAMLSAEQITARVDTWRRRDVSANSIEQAISRLRRVAPEIDARIKRVPKLGYRFDLDGPDPLKRTRLGPSLARSLKLQAGDPVPHRGEYRLTHPLGQSPGSVVWLAQKLGTGEARVFKFALAGPRFSAIKRESTLWRSLQANLEDCSAFVPVVDHNFEAEPYFIGCDYCGESLSVWSEQGNRLLSAPLDARLALFCQIASAVGQAHSVAILHKDLKPGNILITPTDSGWNVRVADFGQGLLLNSDRLDHQQVAQLGFTSDIDPLNDSQWATHLYLAPELREGQSATVRSDIYALGVLLYQLVTGNLKSGLPGDWKQEVRDDLLCEDIEKATARLPADRFGSADEFADHVRMLDRRRGDVRTRVSVEQAARDARQALQSERDRRRARRPLLIALISTLAVGTAVSSWLAMRAIAERKAAETQAERAEAISQFLNKDVLGAADPYLEKAGRGVTIREAAIDAASALDGKFQDYPLTEASIRSVLSKLFYRLDDSASGEPQARRAVELLRRAAGPSSPLTLQNEYLLAAQLAKLGKFKEAATELSEADRRAVDGAEHNPETELWGERAWLIYWGLQQNFKYAIPHNERAILLSGQVESKDFESLDQLRASLADSYVLTGRFSDGEKIAADLLRDLRSRKNPSALTVAIAEMAHVQSLVYAGRYDGAEAEILDAYRTFADKLGPSSALASSALNTECTLYERTNQWNKALDCANTTYAAAQAGKWRDTWYAWLAYANIGIYQYRLGLLENAGQTLDTAYAELKKTQTPDSSVTMAAQYYLADTQRKLKHTVEAEQLARSLNAATLISAEPFAPWEQRLAILRGLILLDQGKPAEAIALLRPAIEALRQKTPTDFSLRDGELALERMPTLPATLGTHDSR